MAGYRKYFNQWKKKDAELQRQEWARQTVRYVHISKAVQRFNLPTLFDTATREELMDTSAPMKIIKCNCGLILRQKDWPNHWNGCYQAGAGAEVTEQDVRDLEAAEDRRAQQDREHDDWMKAQGYKK